MVQGSKFRPIQRTRRPGNRVWLPLLCLGFFVVAVLITRGRSNEHQSSSPQATMAVAKSSNKREQSPRNPDHSIAPESKTKIKHVVPKNSLGQRGYVLKTSQEADASEDSTGSRATNHLVNSNVKTSVSFREALVVNEVAPMPTIEQLAEIEEDPHGFEQIVRRVEAAFQPLLHDHRRDYVQLISMNRFGSIRVILGERMPTIGQLARVELGTRQPESLELEAIERFYAGESTILKSTKATTSIISAIRTEESCRRCHSQRAGEVIGAITLRYRVPGASEPENVFDSL